jgi:hypothetical protein
MSTKPVVHFHSCLCLTRCQASLVEQFHHSVTDAPQFHVPHVFFVIQHLELGITILIAGFTQLSRFCGFLGAHILV